MAKEGKDTVNLTTEFWQPQYSQALTPEDAREIVENVTQFFQILGEWDRRCCKQETELDMEPAPMEADR